MQTQILVIGINHKTAPVEIREKFSLTHTQQDLLLSDLKNHPEIVEAFVLSTCNRVEIYAHVLDTVKDVAPLMSAIFSIKGVPLIPEMKEHFYNYSGKEAIKHLFQVTAGLDSLVLGEKQILGQVKDSVLRAQARGMFIRNFNILTNTAIRTGKKAHAETHISYGGSSVSWASVMMVEKILGTLRDKSVLLVGAGKIGKLTIRQIQKKQARKLYLMNRTHSKAQALAKECQATAVSFYDMKEALMEVDVCICASAAPHYILDKEILRKVMRKRENRRLILVDISVPRNIDPNVSELENIQLFTIDDLQAVVSETMRKRESAVHHVEAIINRKLDEFLTKIAKLESSEVAV